MQKPLKNLGLIVGGMSLLALFLSTQVYGFLAEDVLSVFFHWIVEAWLVSAIAYFVLWWSIAKTRYTYPELKIVEHLFGVLLTMVSTAVVRMGVLFLFGGHAAVSPKGMLQIFLFLVAPSFLAFAVVCFTMFRMHSREIKPVVTSTRETSFPDQKAATTLSKENTKRTNWEKGKTKPIQTTSHSNNDSSNINVAIKKKILTWHQACLTGVDMDLLKKPRPMVGAILFFLGSIDNLCQANNLDDKNFAKLAIELLDKLGFQKNFTVPILNNFYTQQKKSEFAINANIEGGKKLNEFLSGKNEFAPLAFEALVREWAENPNFGQDELSLFQDASETPNPIENKPPSFDTIKNEQIINISHSDTESSKINIADKIQVNESAPPGAMPGTKPTSNPNELLRREIYEQVWNEIEKNQTDVGLWAECFASCEGDETRTKALYMNKRISVITTRMIKKSNSMKSYIGSCFDKPIKPKHTPFRKKK
jgi:hypothetical protein